MEGKTVCARWRGFLRIVSLLVAAQLLIVTAALAGSEKERELDRIVELPGQPAVGFQQYSGYVTVNEQDGRALFYWLTEAAVDAPSKPLILWLNGGPGCSSVAYGASEEIGPFRINKNGTGLHLNEYSWNKVANLLFLESPAGVGFSYTNTTTNLYNTGDTRTAIDAYVFLVKWFQRFSNYQGREFYIAGESYAGHYVPQLAKLVHERNRSSSRPFINFRGFLVGNAVTDNKYDNLGTVDFWWSHAIISDSLHIKIRQHCDFSVEEMSSTCTRLLNSVSQQTGHIDPYNIYMPSCSNPLGRNHHQLLFKRSLLKDLPAAGYDPCIENNAEIYFNRADVQQAFHANTSHVSYPWTACSSTLIRNWQDSALSVLPIYKELIGTGLRIWVFSGDVDSVVPVTATRYSLARLHLKVETQWYPWYHNEQVGGWTEIYEGLTFATVRGAGHEVPLFQPERAFTLISAFLSGQPLPTRS
eukprot:c33718_g1_i1 orf=96-1511(+)